MSSHRLFAVVLSLLLVSPAAGLAAAVLRVATLHPVLTEFAAAIGGEAVQVEGLVPRGVDPHTYEPAPRAVAQARAADLVLATGLDLENYLERIAAPDEAPGRVVRVGERLPGLQAGACTHDHGGEGHDHAPAVDPHWWHGVQHALFVSDLIRAEFERRVPAEAAGFAARAQALQQRLFALQAWAAHEVAALPAERRHLVTSHDAFGYLARELGFTVHPISGLSTESEVAPQQLAALVSTVRRLGVKAIFTDAAGSDRLVRALASETGATVAPPLQADGPGAPGSGVETYDAMYRHNVATIVAALR